MVHTKANRTDPCTTFGIRRGTWESMLRGIAGAGFADKEETINA